MAYIGSSPSVGEFKKLDDISSQFNDATVTFTLQSSGANVTLGNPQNLIISIDGVIQEPGAAYTVGGSDIVFSEAPNTASTFFGVVLGSVGQVNVVGDDTISAIKLQANSVIEAKIATDAVTESKIADDAVTTNKIADLNVTTAKLSTTGVTAAIYGNATLIPTFTVGVDGRITEAGNVALEASGGGSGLFNTAISTSASANVSDQLVNVYEAPATAGKRYVVHSIHVTNVDGTNAAELTGQFVGSTYSDITFATTVPLPAGSSVELLKKPKILQPSDSIQLQANANNTSWVTMTIEEADDDKYFGRGVDVTAAATYTDLYTATANSVIESILLSNDDGVLDVKARVVYTDGSDNIEGYFAYDLIIPADATVEILEQPKFVEDTYKVRVYANQANRLEAIIAGKTV